jgi:hypothetical protein
MAAEQLPGVVPRILLADDVSLLGADETVFDAMLDGWRAQILLVASRSTRSKSARPGRSTVQNYLTLADNRNAETVAQSINSSR